MQKRKKQKASWVSQSWFSLCSCADLPNRGLFSAPLLWAVLAAWGEQGCLCPHRITEFLLDCEWGHQLTTKAQCAFFPLSSDLEVERSLSTNEKGLPESSSVHWGTIKPPVRELNVQETVMVRNTDVKKKPHIQFGSSTPWVKKKYFCS